MMDPKLKQILDFLKSNNASTELITSLESLKTVNLDSVKEFLEKDEDGKKYLQSQKDAAVTKGIDTFKEKTMPGLIEEQISKKFPEETAEQKRLRQLEDDNKKFQNEVKRERLLNKAIAHATEKGFPTKFIEKFLGEDEETTLASIDAFGEMYNTSVSAAVETKFKENGREGGGGNNPPKDEDTSKMTDEEYFKSRLSDQK